MDLTRKTWNKQNIDELIEFLQSISEVEYRNFHKNLVPGCENILGIRLPKLRDIAKKISKGNYREFLEVINDKYYETTMLQGLVIGYCKIDVSEKIELLEKFIPKINNWAICDSTCSSLKLVTKNREEFLKLINKYIKSEEEFEQRFAIVLLMDYYITDEYIDMVLEKLSKVDCDEYYVKMAVAWAFSMCYVKFEDRTMNILCSGKLDKDVLKKSFQKIVESNRVDKDKKKQIRNLRKTMC